MENPTAEPEDASAHGQGAKLAARLSAIIDGTQVGNPFAGFNDPADLALITATLQVAATANVATWLKNLCEQLGNMGTELVKLSARLAQLDGTIEANQNRFGDGRLQF